jgi:proline iminopeptidase
VIIVLHGGPGQDYRSMLRLASRYDAYSLADDNFMVFWDQRGAGLSRRESRSTLTRATYEADLDALIDRYSAGRPVYLVGHSWGAMYATMYINDHPEKVAGAVLIESGPLTGADYERIKNDIRKVDFFAEWLNDYAWGSQFISADGQARMDYDLLLGMRGAQPGNHEQWDVDPEPVWRLGALVNQALQKDGMKNGVADYDFTTKLSRYTTPVLFMTGALSDVLGASLQTVQMKAYPSAQLIVVDGVGHELQWRQPSTVVGHIRNYINSRKGGR